MTAILKLIATFDSNHPVPQRYEPEPELLEKGLLGKLSDRGGFEGDLLVGGPGLIVGVGSVLVLLAQGLLYRLFLLALEPQLLFHLS